MTAVYETITEALRECRNFIMERDKDSPIHQKLDAAFAELADEYRRRESYMPTMDEVYRFMYSNPLATMEMTSEISRLCARQGKE